MKALVVSFMSGLLALGSAGVAAGEETTPGPGPELPGWLSEIDVHAFLSVGFVHDFNDPDSDVISQRFFDFKNDEFRVDDFQFSLLKAAEAPGEAGFRFDLDVGSNIPDVIQSAGLFDDPDGEDIDVRQAYVTYIAPLGNGLTIDFGKYITAFGLEVIEGWPGFNDNYSHSYDFSFAIPFTHTGLRLTYPVNDQFSLMFMAVNGWDKVDDNNDAKGFHGQVAFFPMENVSLYFNYMGSPEQADNDDDWRHLWNVVWVVKPFPATIPALTFSGDYTHGREDNVGIGGREAKWHSFEGVLRYDFTEKFFVAVRGEFMKDEDGARISAGTEQTVWAFTITPTFLVTDHLVVRPEFRYDESNADVFEDDDGAFTEDSQATIGVNVIYYF
ncbi:MAG: porin [Gammaproteobacteria bacterium]|nr:porin [Gammaproteobacteria bacterium]